MSSRLAFSITIQRVIHLEKKADESISLFMELVANMICQEYSQDTSLSGLEIPPYHLYRSTKEAEHLRVQMCCVCRFCHYDIAF